MDRIIFNRPVEAQVSLAALAQRIGEAHTRVEAAVRNSVDYAREAGRLLLEAKKRMSHGEWGSWLKEVCGIVPRTAQRYMRLALHADEIDAKGGSNLSLRAALELIAETESDTETGSPSSNATRVSHLPAPLAYFFEEGLLDSEALDLLTGLKDDYGPDLMSPVRFSRVNVQDAKNADVRWLLNALRPLDRPSLWIALMCCGRAIPADSAVARAAHILIDDGTARGDKVPQWEITAFWFAGALLHLAGGAPKIQENFTTILQEKLEEWREHFRTALYFIVHAGREYLVGEKVDKQWWGYQSDLRHAGVVLATKEFTDAPDAHPTLRRVAIEQCEEIVRETSYALPSAMQ
jgi:hypothetical protein